MNEKSAPSSKQSLTEQSYSKLRLAVLNNVLAPDSIWSDRELCEQFELSRTPVREALLRLQTEQLVQILPRRGTRILPLSINDVQEIHQVTKALELEAALQIAKSKDKTPVLETLLGAVEQMEAALEGNDLDAWAKADAKFHYTVVDMCGNKRIAEMYHSQRGLTDRARHFTLRLRATPHESTREHRQMYEAMLSANLRELEAVYRKHWDRTTEEILNLVKRHSQNQRISPAL